MRQKDVRTTNSRILPKQKMFPRYKTPHITINKMIKKIYKHNTNSHEIGRKY